MAKRKESIRHTYGDLDGISVADLRRMLDEYPDDAVIDVRSEELIAFGGGTDQDQEFFVFTWKE
jgi:hypothetical protein